MAAADPRACLPGSGDRVLAGRDGSRCYTYFPAPSTTPARTTTTSAPTPAQRARARASPPVPATTLVPGATGLPVGPEASAWAVREPGIPPLGRWPRIGSSRAPIGGISSPSQSPPARPPRWAKLSTLPPNVLSPKPNARLITTRKPIWLMIARCCPWSTGRCSARPTSSTPHRPKSAPDAPTLGPGPSVGASGALFGLCGVLLVGRALHRPVLQGQQRAIMSQIGFLVVINLVFGFGFNSLGGNVDNFAHLGGLAGGLWLGLLIPPIGARELPILGHRPGGGMPGSRTAQADARPAHQGQGKPARA